MAYLPTFFMVNVGKYEDIDLMGLGSASIYST